MTPTNKERSNNGNTGSSANQTLNCVEAGYVVRADVYLVVRADWGLSRHCDSLADLQAFARKVGVTA